MGERRGGGRGRGKREREREKWDTLRFTFSFHSTTGSSRMDHRNTSRLSSHEEDEEEEDEQRGDPPSTKMGFYETVASEHASTINRRAFRVSTDKPGPRNDALELVRVEDSTSGGTIQREMEPSEGLKLPPITSTSVIANSAS